VTVDAWSLDAESRFAAHSGERAAPRSKTEVMRRTPALVRLEKKLAEDPCALLTAATVSIAVDRISICISM
jgi:hypothetical protein